MAAGNWTLKTWRKQKMLFANKWIVQPYKTEMIFVCVLHKNEICHLKSVDKLINTSDLCRCYRFGWHEHAHTWSENRWILKCPTADLNLNSLRVNVIFTALERHNDRLVKNIEVFLIFIDKCTFSKYPFRLQPTVKMKQKPRKGKPYFAQ